MAKQPTKDHVVVWFRRDLRLDDNPPWTAACADAQTVTPVFVLDPTLIATAGEPRRNLLFAHLRALDACLAALGGRLHVLNGNAATVLAPFVQSIGADAVYFNNDTSPYATARDSEVTDALSANGQATSTYWGTLVHRPGTVLTGGGTISKVFTPFWKVWDKVPWDPWPDAAPTAAITTTTGEGLPTGDGPPIPGGEEAARDRLFDFVDRADAYLDTRDLPAVTGTSMLSSDLRFGTLSPRQIATTVGQSTEGRAGFVRQLAWRDWYSHLLTVNPTMTSAAIKPEYDGIAWLDDEEGFDAWSKGQTGYPIVDAGMRQLAGTGWMHNRVRMIVGSFLVKDLLIDWRQGERWFRRLLIDGEVAQNAGNWQWVAGTGTDAAPYFRVFNPISQSKKFDSAGDYIRTWVPELASLDSRVIHAPWEASPLDLATAGVVLGDSYPHPIVDHAMARERALAAYKGGLGKD